MKLNYSLAGCSDQRQAPLLCFSGFLFSRFSWGEFFFRECRRFLWLLWLRFWRADEITITRCVFLKPHSCPSWGSSSVQRSTLPASVWCLKDMPSGRSDFLWWRMPSVTDVTGWSKAAFFPSPNNTKKKNLMCSSRLFHIRPDQFTSGGCHKALKANLGNFHH